ncbi:MAG: hypothetical protein JWR38_3740 [Mucilaginibacter sp.]|nr:hypothetical protein [Mucilaginibacter sp.]
MFNHVSWISYLESIIILLLIYYVFIGIRFFSADIRQMLNRLTAPISVSQKTSDPLVYQQDSKAVEAVTTFAGPSDDHYPEDMREADNLMAAVKSCISTASDRDCPPETLKSQIQRLFQLHHVLKSSPHRSAINEWIVSECERTGTAGLTEEEVDQWWGG